MKLIKKRKELKVEVGIESTQNRLKKAQWVQPGYRVLKFEIV